MAQQRDDAVDFGLCKLGAGLGAAVALGEDELAAVFRPVFAVEGAAELVHDAQAGFVGQTERGLFCGRRRRLGVVQWRGRRHHQQPLRGCRAVKLQIVLAVFAVAEAHAVPVMPLLFAMRCKAPVLQMDIRRPAGVVDIPAAAVAAKCRVRQWRGLGLVAGGVQAFELGEYFVRVLRVGLAPMWALHLGRSVRSADRLGVVSDIFPLPFAGRCRRIVVGCGLVFLRQLYSLRRCGAAGVDLHADDPGDFQGPGAGGVRLNAGPVHARQRAAATIPLSVFQSKGDIQLGAQGTVLVLA